MLLAQNGLGAMRATQLREGNAMQAPLFTVLTMLGWEWRNYEVEADMCRVDTGPAGWRRAWRTVLAKRCALPRLAVRVEGSMPFRAIGGTSGWFIVRGVSEPVYNLDCGSVKTFLYGYLETKRMLGLKKEVEGCVCDSESGFYLTYPKDLIDFVLAMAEEDVPHVGLGSIETIMAERRAAPGGDGEDFYFDQAMNNLREVWGPFLARDAQNEQRP